MRSEESFGCLLFHKQFGCLRLVCGVGCIFPQLCVPTKCGTVEVGEDGKGGGEAEEGEKERRGVAIMDTCPTDSQLTRKGVN